MRNANLPIIQALKGHMKPKGETPLHQFQTPRTLEVHHHEIPGLPGRKPGEAIAVNLKGHVLHHSDGKSVIHVSSVAPDSTDMTNKENPKNNLNVRTQESHVP